MVSPFAHPRSGDARAVGKRLQLRPGDRLGNFRVARGRREAAVVAEQDVLRARGLDPALHAVRNHLGVLDGHVGMRHRAGNELFARRELDLPEHAPLVVVARIGRLERVEAGVDGEEEIEHVVELQVRHAWSEVDAVASVIADALDRHPAQRVVDVRDAAPGTLGLTAEVSLTLLIVTHVSIRTSDTSRSPHGGPSQAYGTLRYRAYLRMHPQLRC